MKITKQTKENLTTYFYDNVKKYEHFKNSDGYESWSKYDQNGNEIHYKDSYGDERTTPSPETKEVAEGDIKPFTFS